MATESTGIKGLITSFDLQLSKFAIVSADGRLKIWDTTTGKLQQEISTSNHLNDDYTCISWGNNTRSSTKQSKKSKSKNDLIALGTSRGDIHLVNYTTATVIPLGVATNTDEHLGHKQKVNDLEFSEDGNLLYSCSDDKQIIIWETSTGSIVDTFKADKEPIYSIKLHKGDSGGMLASAGYKIKIFDLTSKKVEHKFSGHTAPVSDLVFTQLTSSKTTYLLSCSSDRFVYMWSLSSDSQHSPIKAFACDSSSIMLDAIQVSNEGVNLIEIMGLSEAGIVSIWNFQEEEEVNNKSKDKKMVASLPISKVEIKNKGKEEGEIISARFTGDVNQLSSSKRKLSTAFFLTKYQSSKPFFEQVEYTSNDGKIKKSVHIDISSFMPESVESKASSKKTKDQSSTTILGVTDMPLPSTGLPATKSLSQENLEENGEEKVSRKKKLKEEKEVVAMEEEEVGKSTAAPKVQSLKQVLVQALHSNDNNLLESCLHAGDMNVINNTVAKLPPHYVLKFLKVIVERFQAKPTRGTELIPWMKSLLVYHSSYLITLPDLVKHLSSLYLAVDSRLSLYKKMMKLSGRLDLLLTQVKENKVTTNYVANSVFTEEDEEEGKEVNESEEEQEEFGDNEPMSDNEANGDNSEEEKTAS